MGIALRLVRESDADELAALLVASREHLEPWEPARGEDYYTPAGQRSVIAAQLARAAAGLTRPFVIVDPTGAIVGRITIDNIVRGAGQFASLGYWIGAPFVRLGYATAAVGLATQEAFHGLRLHRLEAGTLVHNVASQRALERNGFVRYGMAPQLVKIAGAWQDHVLYHVLTDDPTV